MALNFDTINSFELPSWLSADVRFAFLLLTLGVVFLFEWTLPLFRYVEGHLRNAIINLVLTTIFVGVRWLAAPISPYVTSIVTDAQFGLSYWFELSPLVQLVVGIAGLDLFAYFAHVTLHKSAWMWRFHRVHHSDGHVDVTTAFRQHPGETLWRIGWHLLGVIAVGTPLWVLVVYATLSAFNAQLQHGNIRLAPGLDRWLRVLFVTPNMHKAHHSRRRSEHDMNYSNLLSIWDRLGCTYSRGPRFEELRYGLDGFDDRSKQSLLALLKMPFVASKAPIDTLRDSAISSRRAAARAPRVAMQPRRRSGCL